VVAALSRHGGGGGEAARLQQGAGTGDWVLERVATEPHVSTRALAGELAEHGRDVSHVTVWNLLRRARLTHKNTVHPSEQERPDVARRRLRWRAHQNRLDPRRLVFIDETWANTNMAPLQRLVHERPAPHRQGAARRRPNPQTTSPTPAMVRFELNRP
jgi:hypothetical protein